MCISKKHLNISISKRELSNFILFSLGKSVSLFGSFTYAFVIGLYVLKLTGSGLSFATTLVFSTLPIIIINPIGGVLADRFNKKVLVVLMDLLNGMLMIGLFFLSSVYGLSLPLIYISTFIMTSFTTILDTSFSAATPNIVSDDKLISINSTSKIIDSISTILGPMLGGIMFAFVDIKLFIAFNGISFILSGISEMFIDFNFNKKKLNDEDKRHIKFIADVKQGFKYMLGKSEIINSFIVLIFLNFSIGLSISVPLPFIINNILNLSSNKFGIIQGAFPVGLIIGAIFVAKSSEHLHYKRVLKVTNFVLAICIIMLCIPVLPFNIIINKTAILIYYCLVMSIVGVSISFIDIPLLSILQSSISDEYRGRVLSLGMSMVKTIAPVALILSGILIDIFPVYLLQLLGSVILIISNVVIFEKNNKIKFIFINKLYKFIIPFKNE
ncbi:MFS transporter [Oceanirhabdus seepicola]|uniref:MFS transporter n=1 Tax=Oceanirhabdus seepicola TaxID=2828781 RepID=UPI0020327D35|nr:MFS transporter [Oceanirhabdus seepicola]